MPLVSVVMSVYNHEQYVREAISSVLNQTFSDFEFIIINNGCTDNTAAILAEFDDPRIRRFHFSKNKGGSVGFNFGISLAKGKYVAFFCSDDIFYPDKLEKQVRYLENHPEVGAVFSQAEVIDEHGNKFLKQDHFYSHIFEQENRSRHKWLSRFFHLGNCICFPSTMIRKTVLDAVGTFDCCYRQLPDLDYWIRVCLKYEINIIQENLIKYRVRDNELNTSGNTWENVIRNEWEHAHLLRKFFTIDSVGELLQIFPELENKYPADYFVNELIPYYVATICLEKDMVAMKACALEIIYNLLQHSEPLLSEKCNFSYPAFYNLIAKCDIFHATTRNMGSHSHEVVA